MGGKVLGNRSGSLSGAVCPRMIKSPCNLVFLEIQCNFKSEPDTAHNTHHLTR